MKLVEAEAEGPIEGEDAVVTPPRPPHRRVSVSVLFTLTILIGTVVAIYVTFPRRDNLLMTEAIAAHRNPAPIWDLAAPSTTEARAWVIGVVGKDAPLRILDRAKILGTQTIEIHDRRAAVLRLELGTDQVTYLIQRARGIAPTKKERTEGELQAAAWRKGPFTLVTVGPAGTAQSWRPAFTED